MGDQLFGDRCQRVWLGASDREEEVTPKLSSFSLCILALFSFATLYTTCTCTFSFYILLQGVWRDSETDEVLNMTQVWAVGQVLRDDIYIYICILSRPGINKRCCQKMTFCTHMLYSPSQTGFVFRTVRAFGSW